MIDLCDVCGDDGGTHMDMICGQRFWVCDECDEDFEALARVEDQVMLGRKGRDKG